MGTGDADRSAPPETEAVREERRRRREEALARLDHLRNQPPRPRVRPPSTPMSTPAHLSPLRPREEPTRHYVGPDCGADRHGRCPGHWPARYEASTGQGTVCACDCHGTEAQRCLRPLCARPLPCPLHGAGG